MDRYQIQKDDSHLPPEHRRINRKVTLSAFAPNTFERNDDFPKDNHDVFTSAKREVPMRHKEIILPEHEEVQDVPEIHQDSALYIRGLISDAIAKGASDIHIEPKRDTYQVRFRIDGVLQLIDVKSLDEYKQILNTLKVLSDMNIAEHVLPQDGHIELVQQEEELNKDGKIVNISGESINHYYDIRVSVFPSVNGEVIVMRVLNRENTLLSIEELGMDSLVLEELRDVLMTSYGMILVTGPTGSGKTTTLYSVMSELRSEETNIITLEDPIEFRLDWLRQCEIRTERNFTFEKAMESVLRQDPDVLMVGEIRDPKTAEYAVRSALVGRIVGSTIHANTTIGTIARLFELGIPRSIVGHTINAIIAQRLVRKNCDKCKVPYRPNKKLLDHFNLQEEQGPFYKGKGCEECENTGYKGRVGIFSVMTFDDILRNLLFDEKPLIEIQEFSIQKGMVTLRGDAAKKILAGLTTVEEAARII